MSEELGDMAWEEFENEQAKFEKAMSSLIDQFEETVKHLKHTAPTLISIITLVKGYLSGDYVGPTPTVEELCLRILELHKKGMSNELGRG